MTRNVDVDHYVPRQDRRQTTLNVKEGGGGGITENQKHVFVFSQNFKLFRLHGGKMMDLHPLDESGRQKQHQEVCRLLRTEGGATRSPKSNLRNHLGVCRLQPSVPKFNTSAVIQYDNCSRLSKCSGNLQHGSCLLVAPNRLCCCREAGKEGEETNRGGGITVTALLPQYCFQIQEKVIEGGVPTGSRRLQLWLKEIRDTGVLLRL